MEGALRVMFMLPSRPGALAGWAALVFVVLLLLLVGRHGVRRVRVGVVGVRVNSTVCAVADLADVRRTNGMCSRPRKAHVAKLIVALSLRAADRGQCHPQAADRWRGRETGVVRSRHHRPARAEGKVMSTVNPWVGDKANTR